VLLVSKLLDDEDIFDFDDERVLVKLERLFGDNDLVNAQDPDAEDVRDCGFLATRGLHRCRGSAARRSHGSARDHIAAWVRTTI
jgi:hypothetical protein